MILDTKGGNSPLRPTSAGGPSKALHVPHGRSHGQRWRRSQPLCAANILSTDAEAAFLRLDPEERTVDRMPALLKLPVGRYLMNVSLHLACIPQRGLAGRIQPGWPAAFKNFRWIKISGDNPHSRPANGFPPCDPCAKHRKSEGRQAMSLQSLDGREGSIQSDSPIHIETHVGKAVCPERSGRHHLKGPAAIGSNHIIPVLDIKDSVLWD